MKIHKRKFPDAHAPNKIIDYCLCGFYTIFNGRGRALIRVNDSEVTCKTCIKIMRKSK